MSDISQIKTEERTIEILHPGSGEILGIRVGLVSVDDPKLAKIKRQITDRRLHLEARGKAFKADEIEENKEVILFTSMTGWEWYKPEGADEAPNFHGETPEFNRKNVSAVMKELPWFADQINEAVGDTKAFFGNSKRN